MEQIDLHIDEASELTFKVVVQGARKSDTSVRFLLESGDLNLSIPGVSNDHGEISVFVPRLDRILEESTIRGKLEVIAEDRFFCPLEVDVNLIRAMKVEAAVVQRRAPRAGVSAVLSERVADDGPSIQVRRIREKSPIAPISPVKRQPGRSSKITRNDLRAAVDSILDD